MLVTRKNWHISPLYQHYYLLEQKFGGILNESNDASQNPPLDRFEENIFSNKSMKSHATCLVEDSMESLEVYVHYSRNDQ